MEFLTMTSDRARGAAPRPAIVVDGTQHALSVARNLVRHGVTVYALTGPREGVRFSRHVRWIRMADGGSPHSWERFLLGPDSDYLAGAVLLACSDDAINFIALNSQQLSRKFLLEEGDPETRLCLLDKFRTYRKAEEAGIPTVAYELVDSVAQIHAVAERFRFPVIIKPLYSPDAALLGGKIIIAQTKEDLFEKTRCVRSAVENLGVRALVMECVPGDDDLLCSYYTYMDENGTPLVEFTKRLLRRSPMHKGIACYHVTDWNPEAAALGRKFFRHVKLKGLGNIEFKRDLRDGELKVIEANARFTAGDPIVTKSGIDLAAITYDRLTGRPVPAPSGYRLGMVFWLPAEDIRAFFQLRKLGKITFRAWLGSIVRTSKLPYFAWRDPVPSLYVNALRALQLVKALRPRISLRRRTVSRETRR
jgi:D-aspartate ligase